MPRRIYIGGDYYDGNPSSSFPEWSPTAYTPDRLPGMKRYWGVSALSAITADDLPGFTNAAHDDDSHSITYNALEGGYLYYAFPEPLGTPEVYVNGFYSTAWEESTVNMLENGVYVNYTILKSLYQQNGSNIKVKIDLSL